MIIIQLRGGLGNQMFQYALGRRLETLDGQDVRYDLAGFEGDFYGRSYALGCFDVAVRFAEPGDVESVLADANRLNGAQRVIRRLLRWRIGRYGLITERGYGFDASVLNLRSGACLRGYWQSEKYFTPVANRVRSDFTLKPDLQARLDASTLEGIAGTNSVGVHVRHQYGRSADGRVDPAAFAFHGTLPMGYYHAAFGEMTKRVRNPRFFVFSDDIDWCRANLRADAPLQFVASRHDFEDLWLMRLCKHQITANSSFSWWAAWLNGSPHKVVVAPKAWVTDAGIDTADVCPAGWLRI